MSKLRLKVDLTDFYSDHRRKAYVCIRPEYAKIKCLEKCIKKIFDLSNIGITSSDGIYFPSEESIDILEANDTLKIVTLSTDVVSGVPDVPKKKKKKKKRLQIEPDHRNDESMESNVHASGGIIASEVDNDNILAKNCLNISSKEILNSNNGLKDVEEPISSTSSKRKRKRLRKKKTEVTPSPVKNTNISKNTVSTLAPPKGNKHIRFDETNNTEKLVGDDHDDDDDDAKRAPIIKWMNILERIDKSIPRIIHAKVINRSCIKEIVTVETTNVVASDDAEFVTPNELSDQQNMTQLAFLEEQKNYGNLSSTKSLPNGRDISCY